MWYNILRVVVLSVLLTVALNFFCWMFHVILPGAIVLLICFGSFAFASWHSHRNKSR